MHVDKIAPPLLSNREAAKVRGPQDITWYWAPRIWRFWTKKSLVSSSIILIMKWLRGVHTQAVGMYISQCWPGRLLRNIQVQHLSMEWATSVSKLNLSISHCSQHRRQSRWHCFPGLSLLAMRSPMFSPPNPDSCNPLHWGAASSFSLPLTI